MTKQDLINPPDSPKRICVYCASSTQSDAEYRDAAYESGQLLAKRKALRLSTEEEHWAPWGHSRTGH